MEEKNGGVPMEVKDKVERLKKIAPTFTEVEIYEVLICRKIDCDNAAARLLSQGKTEKNRQAVPMEMKDKVGRLKIIAPTSTELEIYEALICCKMDCDDAAERLLSREETGKNREAVTMKGKEKVEQPEETLDQLNIDSDIVNAGLHPENFLPEDNVFYLPPDASSEDIPPNTTMMDGSVEDGRFSASHG